MSTTRDGNSRVVERVIDGDTLVMENRERIRLIGIGNQWSITSKSAFLFALCLPAEPSSRKSRE
jgi:hypothetical protein